MTVRLVSSRLLSSPRGIVARRHTGATVLAAGAAGLGLAVWATSALAADDNASTDVSGVVVTADQTQAPVTNALSKLPANLADIPQSITVLSKELLRTEGATSLADALRNVPGVTIGGAEGGQIGNNINLNGFTARTDIFLDGFRDRGQYYRDTFALDSVEVLMGPSSMLFGRGSTGGAINQVSKLPTLKPESEFYLSGTTNSLFRGTADVDAPLTDNSALRVAAMGQEGAVSTRQGTTVADYGVAPSYRIGIGEPTELTLSALLQHNHDRPDYGVSPLNGAPVKSGFDTIYGYSTDHTDQDIAEVSGEIKHSFSEHLSVRDQLQFNGVDTDAIETASQGLGTLSAAGYTPLNPIGIGNLPLSDLTARLQSHDRNIHDTSLYDQLEANADFDTGPFHHVLLLGTELGHDSYSNQAYTRTGSCNGVPLALGYVGCVPVLNPAYTASPALTEVAGDLAGGKADAEGIYFNDTMSVTPQIKLVGGVRYDNYAASISNSLNRTNTAGNTSFAALNQTVDFTSVRAGAIWHPTEAQSYYVSYSTSFDPSLEQLTSTTGLTQPLPPETNVAYEVGGKWDVLQDRLDLTAAAFQITQDNARSQNSDNTYTADGDIRVRGARVGVTGWLTRRWQIYGGYTYLDGKIVQAIAVGTLGEVPSNTPAHTATLWTTYDISRQWQVGGGATYMSSRFLNNTDLVSVPAYTRIDATIAWRQPRYDVRLNLFNLFDEHYYDSLIQSDGGRAVPGTGRTAMITIAYRP